MYFYHLHTVITPLYSPTSPHIVAPHPLTLHPLTLSLTSLVSIITDQGDIGTRSPRRNSGDPEINNNTSGRGAYSHPQSRRVR